MKILYGVQGTGNGHISRARTMCRALKSYPAIEIHWLFSGRQPGMYFDMGDFGPHRRFCHGLTFATRDGRIDHMGTAKGLRPLRFVREICSVDTRPYDLVISDFEPVTAWAARLQGAPSLGLGHQYALVPGVPMQGDNLLAHAILRWFAPTRSAVGLHWHHFDQPHILPPLLDRLLPTAENDGHILVYLPFENPAALVAELRRLERWQFRVYSPLARRETYGNIELHPPSQESFRRDLQRADSVICNAGFMLVSEALSLGKRILAKPLAGQMEQLSNARALQALELASVCDRIDANHVANWLDSSPRPPPRPFPDVGKALAGWLAGGCDASPSELGEALWRACNTPPAAVAPGKCAPQ